MFKSRAWPSSVCGSKVLAKNQNYGEKPKIIFFCQNFDFFRLRLFARHRRSLQFRHRSVMLQHYNETKSNLQGKSTADNCEKKCKREKLFSLHKTSVTAQQSLLDTSNCNKHGCSCFLCFCNRENKLFRCLHPNHPQVRGEEGRANRMST